MNVGPVPSDASVYARSIASTSWPSICRARQPNASARAAYASPSHWSMVGPRCPSRFMSRIATRFRTPWNDAFSMASHTDPSATSESPIRTQTRPPVSSRRMASAIPSPTGRPCPSEPVATSIHGMPLPGTGCPCTGEPNFRKLRSCSSVMAPIAFSTENISGEAWPFDRTKRSLARLFGSATS